jgi:hypothetical protein
MHDLRYMGVKQQHKGRTDAVGFNDAHLMAVDPKEESGKRAGVDDAESICLPRLEWQCRILVETDMRSDGRGVSTSNRA